tara:strand:+ start:329 stop:577 length:249 start_codon:yes stop_codon:yes gene_type:complete
MTTNFIIDDVIAKENVSLSPFKRLNGRVVFLTSLGSVGRLKGNWCNYPTGSPKEQRLGTLQGELSFWKGQKRETRRGNNEIS